MLNLKRDMLSVALASAIMAMAANAQAQAQAAAEDDEKADEADVKELDAVEVRSGIVAGIENAIDSKRDARSIVEAVSAEDIGKLPDFSIADSLARLPGVTAQRVRGRATDINVRGLSGDFSATTLNGREQASMGINRGVEFDQYPAELMKQVLVYKTPQAGLVGQGLSATIDLQTIRPLDFDKRTVAVNLRADRNQLESSDIFGERGSVTYIDQNDARTLGLVLGYAYLNTPGQSNSWRAWGYDGTGLLEGATIQSRLSDQVREGFNATLEYRPNDAHRGALDVFYSQFDSSTTQRGIEIGLGNGGYLTNSGVVRGQNSFTWTGASPVFRTDKYDSEDELLSVGWNHEWTINEDWKVTADLSISKAERNGRNFESNAGLPPGSPGTTLTATFNPGGWYDMRYGLDFNNPSQLRLWDRGGWGGDGFDKPYTIDDEIQQARIDFERSSESGFISSLEFGANLTKRDKDRFATEDRLCINSCSLSNQTAPYPSGGNFAFGFFGIPFLPSFDPSGVNYARQSRFADFGGARKSFGVEEDITTAYIQANLDTEYGSIPVSGNIGVQVQRVDQTGFGRITYNGNASGTPFEDGDSYTNVLPSLNLIADLPWEQKLRFGAARQVARPRIDDLSAGFGYGVNQTAPGGPRWEAGGGNPTLRPWKADALDLSWEKYFGGRGYVSIAYFHKDLLNYVANQSVRYDFTGLPIPAGVTALPASRIGVYTRPVNAEGGTIKGFEYAVSLPFDLMWQPLEGFGLQASYTDTTTSIDPRVLGVPQLPGFSKYTSNVTLYWERFGWGVRATRRTRSSYVGEGVNVFLDSERSLIGSEEIVDLQVSYTVQEGPIKDLGFIFQISNLTDEPFTRNFGAATRPQEYVEYGNNALLGISYKF